MSKIDLKKAYWHIPLAKESRACTSFLTESHGLLQFKRLPMGMTDSGASFQSAVEKCLRGLDGVEPYIDDILIWGKTAAEHDDRVWAVFGRLNRDGFRVTEAKIHLARQQLSMLGQLLTVTDDGIEIIPDPERTEDILNIPPPTTLRKLQQFLGAANYFSSHIPHFATIAEPLFKLKRKKTNKFLWDDACNKAFETIKDAIASPKVLVPFDPSCQVHLTTDASLFGLGAVLSIER
ncbi:MAG: RNA-directed DNA polymerase, partial [Gammaproteobacteria bacterium]|nr:RNA-directed DNA polymerase [Gammaproteobacteria bacterium]